MLKNVDLDWLAIHLPERTFNKFNEVNYKELKQIPIKVFPVPGGPKSKIPEMEREKR